MKSISLLEKEYGTPESPFNDESWWFNLRLSEDPLDDFLAVYILESEEDEPCFYVCRKHKKVNKNKPEIMRISLSKAEYIRQDDSKKHTLSEAERILLNKNLKSLRSAKDYTIWAMLLNIWGIINSKAKTKGIIEQPNYKIIKEPKI